MTSPRIILLVPGAAQREAVRCRTGTVTSSACATVPDAVHHFVLHRVRDKKAYAAFSSFFGAVIAPDALISLSSEAL